MPTRIARFHNVYGPLGTHGGGRKKAPGPFFSWIGVGRFLRFGFREVDDARDGEGDDDRIDPRSRGRSP